MNNVCILSHDQVTNTISIGHTALDCRQGSIEKNMKIDEVIHLHKLHKQ